MERNLKVVEGFFGWGQALEKLNENKLVSKSAWLENGKFMFLVPGSTFAVNRPPLNKIFPEGTIINYRPHIDYCLKDGSIEPFVASTSDLLDDTYCEVSLA